MIARLLLSLAAAGLAAVSTARAEDADVLNIYNWSDYSAEDTVKRFEAETGIKVHYDVYDSNEVLEAKLLADRSGYDLVVPSASPFLARQIVAGVSQTLDKPKLANYGNLDPQILAAAGNADPGNRYGVPYLWGTTGNQLATELVDEQIRDDPNIYPPPEVRARLLFDKPVTAQYERLRTRAWTKVKTGT